MMELLRWFMNGDEYEEVRKCSKARVMSQIEEILKATQPEIVFPYASKESVHSTFNRLVKQIHPDVCPGEEAKQAFIKLHALRDEALDRLEKGTWETPGVKMFKCKDGRAFQAVFRKKVDFELGTMYDGACHQVFHLKKEYKDIFYQAETNIARLPEFADAEMKKRMGKVVPHVIRTETLVDDSHMMSISKLPGVIRLRDVLDHFGGSLDPHHVAWIVSRLLNISCWFQYSGIAHYGLTVDNLYIQPATHEVFVYGGWWYAHDDAASLVAVPRIVLDNTLKTLYEDKVATVEINQNLARMVGRELCGDIAGATLMWDKNIPQPMRDFLLYPASDNAIDDYRRWRETLEKSFGKPKFIHLDISADKLYYGKW